MKFTVHDVGHGACASLTDAGQCFALFDCGDTDLPNPWSPGTFLRQARISEVGLLAVSNFDEDHVRGLPGLLQQVRIRAFARNQTVPADWLERQKREGGGVTAAMSEALRLHRAYVHDGGPLALPVGVTLRNYSNRFGEFDDTNNLSLVTFLDVSGTRFALTGDIEEAGWLKLIQNAEVQRELQGTHVFFASHHGREGGYCRQVFDFCRPHVVVISDGAKQHATQETTSVYAQHASGISFGGATRSVLTTRSDGTFSWTW